MLLSSGETGVKPDLILLDKSFIILFNSRTTNTHRFAANKLCLNVFTVQRLNVSRLCTTYRLHVSQMK